ncbi:MAG: hypothetical protein FWC85_01820 [Elusimicrobia bacterium]|nr:hypothetical protein [Elusimicrobiota bacterium]
MKNKRLKKGIMPSCLITSGATKEYLDPIRYITNASTGAMGAALAAVALKKGANVTFITGVDGIVPVGKCKVIKVVSAKDMLGAVKENLNKHDVLIFAAAVGDWAVQKQSKLKIKKKAQMALKLVENPDISAYAGAKKNASQVSVCFALETNNFMQNARKKLKNKNADFIVLNTASTIGSKNTDAKIIYPDGSSKEIASSKSAAAVQIINEAVKLFEKRALTPKGKRIVCEKI